MKYFYNNNTDEVESLSSIITGFREHYYSINDIAEMHAKFDTREHIADVAAITQEFNDICTIFNALRVNDSYTFFDSEMCATTFRRVSDSYLRDLVFKKQ